MRGRALASMALLCGTWVTARIAFTTMDIRAVSQTGHETYPHSVRMGSVLKLPSAQTSTRQSPKQRVAAPAVRHTPNIPTKVAVEPEGTTPLFVSAGTPVQISPATFLPTGPDVVTPIDAPRPNAQAAQGFEVYAYSFWRRGSSPAGTLGNGQYGGSQSAVIAVLRFSGNPGPARLSLTGRASVAHGSVRDRELAAGVRWRPVARIPVQIIAERRLREDRPDPFAALVAGGRSDITLPLGFRLDGYGQPGFVSGQGGGPFADVAAHAHRPIAQSHSASFAISAGIWGGGQDNVMRADVGPNVRANVTAGDALFQLEASWRVRVAGHAQPGNGPAVTLSTSF